MIRIILAGLALLALALPASAHHRARHAHHHYHVVVTAKAHQEPRQARILAPSGSGDILPHPAGCPLRLFCGCGVAVHLFGSPHPELWAARAWLRFPRAEPSPGMVAVRRDGHHVMAIERYDRERQIALVFDANSGHGLTRLHWRSLANYSVHDPRGG